MDSMHHTDLLAKWRKTEQALETGLDPEIAKRLDDLRAEDARLMRQVPIRTIDRTARPLLRRAG